MNLQDKDSRYRSTHACNIVWRAIRMLSRANGRGAEREWLIDAWYNQHITPRPSNPAWFDAARHRRPE